MSGSRPFNELLSDVLLALSREYEDAGAGEDPPPSVVMWSGLLRGLRPGGITVKELAREVRLAKRAVLGWLGPAATWGYLVTERPGRALIGDRVDVTDKWRAAADEWPGVEAAAAKAWRKRVGATADKELRAALEDLVSRFGLELPHLPDRLRAGRLVDDRWQPPAGQARTTARPAPRRGLVARAA